MDNLKQLPKNQNLKVLAFVLGIISTGVLIYSFSLQAILNRRKLDEQNRQKELAT